MSIAVAYAVRGIPQTNHQFAERRRDRRHMFNIPNQSHSDAGSSASPLTAAVATEVAEHLQKKHGLPTPTPELGAETAEILAEIETSLKADSDNKWELATLFHQANKTMSYDKLADWAKGKGYRQYTRQYIQQLATTAQFFGGKETDRPFTHYVEIHRAMKSLQNQCGKLKIGVTTMTAAEVLDVTKSASKRSEIFAALRAKFAPTLPEKVSQPNIGGATVTSPKVGELPLYMLDLNVFEQEASDAGTLTYRIVIAAKDESAVRKLIGSPIISKTLDAKTRKLLGIKGSTKLPYAASTFTLVGSMVIDRPMVMAIIPLVRDFTTTEVAETAAKINE